MGTPQVQALQAKAERRARVARPYHQDQPRALRALAASICPTAGYWEPDELRGSRPDLRERGGETPPRHSTETRDRCDGRDRERPAAGDQRSPAAAAAIQAGRAAGEMNCCLKIERKVRSVYKYSAFIFTVLFTLWQINANSTEQSRFQLGGVIISMSILDAIRSAY